MWQRKKPVDVLVTCEIAEAEKDSNWLTLRITARNLSAVDWQFRELSFVPANSAKGVSFSVGGFIDDFTGREFDPALAAVSATSPVPMVHRLQPFGTPHHPHGGNFSDTTTEVVYLHRASIRFAKLSMRLSLISMDAVQRKIVIAITRELPPPITAATI